MNGNNNSGSFKNTTKIKQKMVNKNRMNNPIDRENSYFFQTKQNPTDAKTISTEQNKTIQVGIDPIMMKPADIKSDSLTMTNNPQKREQSETNLYVIEQDTRNRQHDSMVEPADQVYPVNTDYVSNRANAELPEDRHDELINYLSGGIAAMKYGQICFFMPRYPDI